MLHRHWRPSHSSGWIGSTSFRSRRACRFNRHRQLCHCACPVLPAALRCAAFESLVGTSLRASGLQPIGLRVGAGRGLADLNLCRAPLCRRRARPQLPVARRACDGLRVCGSAKARLANFASAALAPTVEVASLRLMHRHRHRLSSSVSSSTRSSAHATPSWSRPTPVSSRPCLTPPSPPSPHSRRALWAFAVSHAC